MLAARRQRATIAEGATGQGSTTGAGAVSSHLASPEHHRPRQWRAFLDEGDDELARRSAEPSFARRHLANMAHTAGSLQQRHVLQPGGKLRRRRAPSATSPTGPGGTMQGAGFSVARSLARSHVGGVGAAQSAPGMPRMPALCAPFSEGDRHPLARRFRGTSGASALSQALGMLASVERPAAPMYRVAVALRVGLVPRKHERMLPGSAGSWLPWEEARLAFRANRRRQSSKMRSSGGGAAGARAGCPLSNAIGARLRGWTKKPGHRCCVPAEVRQLLRTYVTDSMCYAAEQDGMDALLSQPCPGADAEADMLCVVGRLAVWLGGIAAAPQPVAKKAGPTASSKRSTTGHL